MNNTRHIPNYSLWTIPNSVFYNFLSLKGILVYLPIDQTRLAKSVEAARIKEAPAS